MSIDKNGKLLKDLNFDVCTPTFAGFIFWISLITAGSNGKQWVESPLIFLEKRIKTSNYLYQKEYTIIGRLTRFEVVLHNLKTWWCSLSSISVQQFECNSFEIGSECTVLRFESTQESSEEFCPHCGGRVHVCDNGSMLLKDMPLWHGLPLNLDVCIC